VKGLALILLAACDLASSERGYDSALQVAGAQFRPGAFPAPTGGPDTISIQTSHATIVVGTFREKLKAILAPDASAAIVARDGDAGAWIVTAGPPDVDTMGNPTAAATFGLAADAPLGAFTLVVAAVDGAGHIGAPGNVQLVADRATPPDGDLVVRLVWPSTADLDLHVIDPSGGEAWSGHPSTYTTAPGQPVDPLGYLSSGILDHDANASCARDGAPDEDVIWTTRAGPMGPVAPVIASGTYTIRVDTVAMCGDAAAYWHVFVLRDVVGGDGELLAEASGVSTAADVLLPADVTKAHRAGAGVTALSLTLP
jgi:hypothetical protein